MLIWRRDAVGNRISTIEKNYEKFSFKITPQFDYSCEKQYRSFSALIKEEIFKGTAKSLKEAMDEVEKKYEEYIKITSIETSILNICKEPLIFYQDYRVYIKADPEDIIRYTTNGKDVKKSNKIYREPFLYTEGMIVKAIAFNDNKTKSTQAIWEKEI